MLHPQQERECVMHWRVKPHMASMWGIIRMPQITLKRMTIPVMNFLEIRSRAAPTTTIPMRIPCCLG